ncbi:TonB-dependent receptor [Chitinophaga oryzae]|uniref:TonB-dependent receptor n=1 Tax=Chitinophaga oryzae TaxID=2725414 RepID=A0ABX6LGM6_9BACT|nr:outer membrane beta-barrel family protein [Chitinophaga oryzae]QJB39137.1 TonB-dependent receptor [Chitinophaga oryzae]
MLTTVYSFAQQRVSGNTGGFTVSGAVLDSTDRHPIGFATVVLLREGKVINSTTTDSLGRFNLPLRGKGVFVLGVSFVGYNNYQSAPGMFPGAQQPYQVLLRKSTTSLQAVTINAKKKLIETKGDKLIYNATADISNKAGSAADVLKKVPMLTVSADGEVKMRGDGNIKVLLNGLPSGILAKNLKEALKIIPAGTIASVEVITSPSAKYEAEGTAGIINIITKKKIKGSSADISISAGNLEQSASASLNTVSGNFDLSLNINASNQREHKTAILNRTSLFKGQPAGELLQENDITQHERGVYGDLGVTYRIDSLQKISTTFTLWNGAWPSKNTLYNLYQDGKGSTAYNQKSDQANHSGYYELSTSYQKLYHRKGQELQVLGMVSNSADRSRYNTQQYTLAGMPAFRETGPNNSKSWDFNLQTDYAHPLDLSGKNIVETGVKFSRTSATSAYSARNNEHAPGSDDLVEIPSRSDEMKYFQHIYAAYLSIKLETRNQWMFRAGLRYEATQLGAGFRRTSAPFRSSFGNLVPGILLAKTLNGQHDVKLSYTERIRRPWIWDLNPFVNASDPRNLTSGNPLLRPETTRTIEAGYNYNAALGFTLNNSVYFSSNSNAIEMLTTVDSTGISRTSPSNVAANKRLGANVNAAVEIGNLTVNGGIELYQVWFKSDALQVKNDAGFYSFHLNLSYALPKDVTLQASGDYSNGYVTLQGRNSASWSYSFAAQKEFLNKKASVLVGVSNPFQRSMLQRSYATAPTFRSTEVNNYYNRSFHITLNWKFGSMKAHDNEEEKKMPPVRRH